MRKYSELNSKDRANYWYLMNVLDVVDEYGGNLARAQDAKVSIHILATNLKLELFTDQEDDDDN